MNAAQAAVTAQASERPSVEFGYRSIRLRTPWWSARLPMRPVVVSTLLAGLAVIGAAASLLLGDYPLSPGMVRDALLGNADSFPTTVVTEWRLPIALSALLFGGLLGIGGAIFQSLTRNPLGSPDVIGFDAGAYTAVVITVLVVGARGYWVLAGAAIGGGLIAAMVIYLLAYRRGVQGFRLIIVGIAVSAVLGSLNSYLITRAEVDDAISVGFWAAGSLNRISWTSLWPASVLGALIVLAAALLSPALRKLELGDDAAVTQGLRVNRARLALMVTGVATSALVTAAAGPIGFIALVAPQLARRMTGSAGAAVFSAAATGAALLVAAQLTSLVLAQLYRPVPVGLITLCLGGLYLIWLLIHESRRHESRHRSGATS